MPNCYYYDEQRNRCKCYVNKNLDELLAENAKLHDELAKWERLAAGIDMPEYPVTQFKPKDLERENAKLREQMERLVTLLRVDCDIDASWDGLRRFWSMGLTENGCLMRDRACKAEAENAKLRELVRDYERCTMHADCSRCEYDGKLSTHCPLSPCFPDADELCELGIEVDA